MKILVIIPAYNEEESILNVITKLNRDMEQADYVVVNDCSTDSTIERLQETEASYLNLPVNLGIGGGVQTGYKYALLNDYDIAIQIDGDGQHDTNYLQDVIQPIIDGEKDIVIGSRFLKKEGFQSSGMRRVGITFLSGLIQLCSGIKIYDVTSGFRAVNREYIRLYASDYPVDYPEPEAIVMAALEGARIGEVPVIMKERVSGKSSISALKSVYYMIKVSLAVILCRVTHRKRKQ